MLDDVKQYCEDIKLSISAFDIMIKEEICITQKCLAMLRNSHQIIVNRLQPDERRKFIALEKFVFSNILFSCD